MTTFGWFCNSEFKQKGSNVMIIDEDSIDFKKYFVVDQSSPTGLRWRDDVKRLEEGKVGGNSWGRNTSRLS